MGERLEIALAALREIADNAWHDPELASAVATAALAEIRRLELLT